MKHLVKLLFLSLTLVLSVQGFSGALVIKPADGVNAFEMPNSLQGLTVDDVENLSIKQIELSLLILLILQRLKPGLRSLLDDLHWDFIDDGIGVGIEFEE